MQFNRLSTDVCTSGDNWKYSYFPYYLAYNKTHTSSTLQVKVWDNLNEGPNNERSGM